MTRALPTPGVVARFESGRGACPEFSVCDFVCGPLSNGVFSWL